VANLAPGARLWQGPAVRNGDTLEIEIAALGPEGEGLASHDGLTVHVPGAFPGERVQVRIAHMSRQHPRAHAELRQVLTPHPERRVSHCVHHRDPGNKPNSIACTGCPLLSLAVTAQRTHKQELLASSFGLHVDHVVAAPEEFGYRWSSKRVVGGRPGALILGSYMRDSHKLVPMHACRVDHPEIVLAAEELRRVADSMAIEPYDERSGAGDLRYVWLKTDGHTTLLTLVTARTDSRAASELPERLRRPAGLAWSVQPGPGNNLRGQAPVILRGEASLNFSIADIPLTVGPLGFLQPNPTVAALAYHDLITGPTGEPLTGELALDLYAGAGVTTQLLRNHFAEVRACEAYPESAAQLGLPPERAEDFLERQQTEGARPGLVIANPPREGLGPRVVAALQQIAPQRLHIMSCGPAGLARDLAALAGDYQLLGLRAYDTLPQTPHVELVAWLERRTTDRGEPVPKDS